MQTWEASGIRIMLGSRAGTSPKNGHRSFKAKTRKHISRTRRRAVTCQQLCTSRRSPLQTTTTWTSKKLTTSRWRMRPRHGTVVALCKQPCIRASKNKCPSWTPRTKLSDNNNSSSSNRCSNSNSSDRARNRCSKGRHPNRPRSKSIAYSSSSSTVAVRRSRQPYHSLNRNYKRRQRPQQPRNRALSLVRMSAPSTLIKSTR